MNVIIWHEKHGSRVTAATPAAMLKVLEARYNDGYWYDNWEEGPKSEWADRAEGIVSSQDKQAAQAFLHERREHEYEGFEIEEVDEG